MQIIAQLERLVAEEESPFRAQLFREDVVRLRKLEELAQSAADLEAFKKAGLRIGWTPGDARTAELHEPLEALLEAVYRREEARVGEAWHAMHRLRMERLLGCLSTPVPKPADPAS